MDRENSYTEENIERDEWLKKILVVFVAISVLGGTYYYTGMSSKKNLITQQHKAVEQDLKVVKPNKKSDLNIIKGNIIADKQKVINNTGLNAKNTEYSVFSSSKIMPSSRSLAARQALLAAGKKDPFSGGTTKKIESIKSLLPKYLGQNPLVSSPMFGNIPKINSLPSLNAPYTTYSKSPLIATSFYPEVQGFIGNKAIISINGESAALKENDSFHNIKVIKVDPKAMTVKFIQNKQVMTKNLQGLN